MNGPDPDWFCPFLKEIYCLVNIKKLWMRLSQFNSLCKIFHLLQHDSWKTNCKLLILRICQKKIINLYINTMAKNNLKIAISSIWGSNNSYEFIRMIFLLVWMDLGALKAMKFILNWPMIHMHFEGLIDMVTWSDLWYIERFKSCGKLGW
jgi:hypothetical protein